MKLKVCGMKFNSTEVAELHPDYLGFIFWKPSKRFFDGEIPYLPSEIKKIGVFVDAEIEDILQKVEEHDLSLVQLHGQETVDYCSELKENLSQTKIIKVFSVNDDFNFKVIVEYEKVCDFYLFDTKGKLPGGNGYGFDWMLLKNYPSKKPYFLSGGIGLGEMGSLKKFLLQPESKYCHAIDVNSKFEMEPGLKEIKKLKEFKELIIEN
jgi:phosphoribosylanthranilate isomerase